MTAMRVAVLGLTALLLAGCGSSKVDPVEQADPATIGYLVGTVGQRPGEPYAFYGMRVCDEQRRVVATFDYRLRLAPFETAAQKEVLQPGFNGSSFAVPLPAGRYTLCSYAFTGDGLATPRNGFGQPITIEAQKANYIGRYMGIATYENNLYGNPVPANGYWVVTDAQADDMGYILKREPAVAGLAVASSVPHPAVLLKPYFYSSPQPSELKAPDAKTDAKP